MPLFQRFLLSAILILTISATASESHVAKPSWEWTTEERIAARLDPAKIRGRLQAYVSRKEEFGATRGVVASSAVVATFVIEGSTHPELFMPWELIERLLNTTQGNSPHSEAIRGRYLDDIAAFGWSTTYFWSELDLIATEYVGVRNNIQQISNTRVPERDSDALRPDATAHFDDLRQSLCAVRAQTLERARQRFGRTEFDRFLYERIAPDVTVFSDDPMKAADLRRIAEGCR